MEGLGSPETQWHSQTLRLVSGVLLTGYRPERMALRWPLGQC